MGVDDGVRKGNQEDKWGEMREKGRKKQRGTNEVTKLRRKGSESNRAKNKRKTFAECNFTNYHTK